eukprot:929185-Prorocentrum_minimum.AAC.1
MSPTGPGSCTAERRGGPCEGRHAQNLTHPAVAGGVGHRQPVAKLVEFEVRNHQVGIPSRGRRGSLTQRDHRVLGGAVPPHQLVRVAPLEERAPHRRLVHVPAKRSLTDACGPEL